MTTLRQAVANYLRGWLPAPQMMPYVAQMTMDRYQLQRVVKLGQETVRAGGRDIVATHYRLETTRPRDVWYDASGRWVKMRAIARDGSTAEWVMK